MSKSIIFPVVLALKDKHNISIKLNLPYESTGSMRRYLRSAPSRHSAHPSRFYLMLLRTLTLIRKHVYAVLSTKKNAFNIRTARITILFCLVDDVNVDFRDVKNLEIIQFKKYLCLQDTSRNVDG